MIDNLYSALKRRRCGRAVTSESGSCRAVDGGAPAALPASPLRSEAANAAEEVLVLLVLIKVRFLSPPYSNFQGLLVSHMLAQRVAIRSYIAELGYGQQGWRAERLQCVHNMGSTRPKELLPARC